MHVQSKKKLFTDALGRLRVQGILIGKSFSPIHCEEIASISWFRPRSVQWTQRDNGKQRLAFEMWASRGKRKEYLTNSFTLPFPTQVRYRMFV